MKIFFSSLDLAAFSSPLRGVRKVHNRDVILIKNSEWCELIQNISEKGCVDSFRKLFDHFYPLLVSQNLKNNLSHEIATELAQDAMLKVWKLAGSFDHARGSVFVWIYTIARNCRFDYFRNQKSDPLNIRSVDIFTIDESLIAEGTILDDLLDLELMKEELSDLPSEQQRVIEKVYFEGFTQQEVSLAEQLPLGTVKSRLRLAISALKTKLGKEI